MKRVDTTQLSLYHSPQFGVQLTFAKTVANGMDFAPKLTQCGRFAYKSEGGTMLMTRNRVLKAMLALDYGVRGQGVAKKTLANLYNQRIQVRGRIATSSLGSQIGVIPQITLVDFVPEHGNVTPFELVCLCSLVRHFKPKRVLEIGTFDGNTTLQISANLEKDAIICTLDLPLESKAVQGNDLHDVKLIANPSRKKPRYFGSAFEHQVRQIYGNSLDTDFSTLCDSPPQLVFIDAGHSYVCVKNDTEKSLSILGAGGLIVWHDYTQDWPDVYRYLNELALQLPLKHIEGTNLVVYKKVM